MAIDIRDRTKLLGFWHALLKVSEIAELGSMTDSPPQGAKPRLSASLRRLVQVLAFLFVVNTFVLPQLAGTRDAISLIGDLNPILLALGTVAEVASLWCVAHLIRTLLPAESRPSPWTVQRIVLAARAASRVVPGGAAAGGVLSYRLLRRVGVPTSEAGFSVGAQSLESAAVLVGLLFIALLASIPVSGLSPGYLTAVITGVVLLALLGGLLLAITRGEDRAVEFVHRLADRVRVLDGDAIEGALRTLAAQITELTADRRELARHAFWSAAYWLLDATALAIFLAAYGHWTRPDGLVIAFALANIVATLPITPGGLGVMEVTLVASLVGFGVPSSIALLGVVSWRLVNFWLPIPAGAAAYLSLRLRRPDQGASDELDELTEEARGRSKRDQPMAHRPPRHPAPDP